MRSTFPLLWIAVVFLLLVWLVAMVCGRRAIVPGLEELPGQRQMGQMLRALALITVIGSLASVLNLFGVTLLIFGLTVCAVLQHSWQIRRILGDFASVFEIWERVRNPAIWQRMWARFWLWLKNQGSGLRQSMFALTPLVWIGVTSLMAVTFFFAKGQFAIANLRLLHPESYHLLLQSKYILFNTVTTDRTGNGLAVLTATLSLLSATDALQVVRALGPMIAFWLAGATGYVVFWATGQKLAGIVTACLAVTGLLSGPIPVSWLQLTWPPEPAAAFGLKLLTICNEAVGRSLAGLPFEAALAIALCTWPALATAETPDQLWDGLAGIGLTTLFHPSTAVGLLLAALVFHVGVRLASRLAVSVKQLFFGALAWVLAVGAGHGLILLQSHAQLRSRLLFSWLAPPPQTTLNQLPPVHWTGTGILEALHTAPGFVFLAGGALLAFVLCIGMVLNQSGSKRIRLFGAGWLVLVWTGSVIWSGIDPLQPVPLVFQEVLHGWPLIVMCWIGLGVGALMNWIEAAFPRFTQSSLLTALTTLIVCAVLIGTSLWRGNLPPFQPQDQTLRFWCGNSAQAGGLSLLEYNQSARIVQQLARQYPRGEWMVIAPTEQFIEVFGRGWHIDLYAWSQQFTLDQVQSPEFRFPIDSPHTFVLIEKRPWISDPRPQPSVVGFAQQTDITFRMYRSPAGRSSLMQSALNLLNAYGQHHHDLGVLYEDDHLVVFHLVNQKSTHSMPFRFLKNGH